MSIQVQLAAFTVVADEMEDILERDEFATDAQFLSELAGRECYQSHDKPNADTEANDDYIRNILLKKHFSVLEHGHVTLRITGVSRALTHELVRHRHFSPSQLSQRFVDAELADYVTHPDISAIEDPDERQRAADILAEVWDHCLEAYGELQGILEGAGAKRKVKNQAARMVLPNMTETKLIFTGNHRAWREFLEKRLSEQADAEIRMMAEMCLDVLRPLAPEVYEEF